MLIPSTLSPVVTRKPSLSRRVNANSQLVAHIPAIGGKLIKKGEC